MRLKGPKRGKEADRPRRRQKTTAKVQMQRADEADDKKGRLNGLAVLGDSAVSTARRLPSCLLLPLPSLPVSGPSSLVPPLPPPSGQESTSRSTRPSSGPGTKHLSCSGGLSIRRGKMSRARSCKASRAVSSGKSEAQVRALRRARSAGAGFPSSWSSSVRLDHPHLSRLAGPRSSIHLGRGSLRSGLLAGYVLKYGDGGWDPPVWPTRSSCMHSCACWSSRPSGAGRWSVRGLGRESGGARFLERAS